MHLMLPLHFVGAEHFPKENVQLCKNAVFFALQKTKMRTFCWCVAKMHLMQKCIFATRTFSKGKCSAYIFLWKMFSCAKMHLMPKCIFAYILRSKMFSITFSTGKCSATMRALHDCSKNAFDALQKYIFASHFVTQNVTNAFDALRCKNAFLHQMLF